MSIVTISRMESSGGYETGKQVAHELGYRLITKQTIEKIFHQYGMVEFDKQYESEAGFWDSFDNFQQQSIHFLKRVHIALAHHDNVVIVGRGSFATLHLFSDVFNARLWAPFDTRVNRYMDSNSITDHEKAEKMVRELDKRRETFVRTWFHTPPDNASLFDMTINTGKVSLEDTASLITRSVRRMEKSLPEKGKQVKQEIIDLILEESIEHILESV